MDTTRIAELAKMQGKSMTYLCSLIGKYRSYLNDVKVKNMKMPEEYLEIIAADLGTTPEYLKWETDDPKPESMDSILNNDADVVIYRRDGKTTVRKLTPEQLRMFERLLNAVDDSNSEL